MGFALSDPFSFVRAFRGWGSARQGCSPKARPGTNGRILGDVALAKQGVSAAKHDARAVATRLRGVRRGTVEAYSVFVPGKSAGTLPKVMKMFDIFTLLCVLVCMVCVATLVVVVLPRSLGERNAEICRSAYSATSQGHGRWPMACASRPVKSYTTAELLAWEPKSVQPTVRARRGTR